MGADIFLSYVHEDEDRARELAEALEQEGYSVFWDRHVPVGESWHSYIGHALAEARCVVVAWSRHAVHSDWVIEEASSGRSRGILVPVLLDGTEPPFGFASIQAADLSDWDGGRETESFTELLAGVARAVSAGPTIAQQTASPPPAQRLARRWDRRHLGALVAVALLVVGLGWWWFSRDRPEVAANPPQDEAEPVGVFPVQPIVVLNLPDTPAGVVEEFRDCDDCPLMTVVPAGAFAMGSPDDEVGRRGDEGPQHLVTIAKPLALGRYEVTFDEWDACIADGGCNGFVPDDRGFGRGTRPVIGVSWDDATAYAIWLSGVAGEEYRLPSEAEWEYAARAGTTTPYALPAPKGSDDIAGKDLAACGGCGSKWDSTAPVGSFPPNGFGFHDMQGNVWEWVKDCWNESYDGAPDDGSAWTSGSCERRVRRGGSWSSNPGSLRSAARNGNGTTNRSGSFGFRVARTLR